MTSSEMRIVIVEDKSRFDKVLTVIGIAITAVALFWPEVTGEYKAKR